MQQEREVQHGAEVETFFETASDRLQPVLAPALPDGVILSFEISGPGGGRWTLEKRDGAVRLRATESRLFDCRIACSAADFDALLQGRLDTRQAFLDGRLRIEGDVGLARRLAKAFRAMGPRQRRRGAG